MNKEPIGLYIFRFLLGFGLFAFMCMLYWSSVIIEQNLLKLSTDFTQLKNEIYDLRSDINQVRGGFKQSFQEVPIPRREIDTSYQNLLEEDPFYAETLPNLLGDNFTPDGTFHEASIGKPDNLHPFNNWSHISTWISLCSVTVGKMKFGIYETTAPNMAIKVEERPGKGPDAPEYWVHLRDHVYWQPIRPDYFTEPLDLAPHFLGKHKVTAHDFKFFFDALMNPFNQEPGAVSLRVYLGDIEEIEVIDDLTFVVRWRAIEVEEPDGTVVPKIKYAAKLLTSGLQPLASFVYKYFADGTKIIEDDSDPDTYRTNSVWAQNFKEHWAKNIIVSCGPWIFNGITDQQINFIRNPEFYFPLDALIKRRETVFKNSPDSMWQDFKVGKLDTYSLQPDQQIELAEFMKSKLYKNQVEKGEGIERLDYLARTYVYIGWNQNTPYFKSEKIRRAMTMAIDRNRIIEQNLNGMGEQLTGPFFKYSPSYDQNIKPWPFDPLMAKRLLEEEGWFDTDGDGILNKEIDGKKISFQFSLTYYVKSTTVKAICEYIATALKEIGIICNLNGVDIADLSMVFDDKNFDALCLGWALGTPPENPKQLWSSAGAKEKGSSNAVGFQNKEADQIINQLEFERNTEKRLELYHRFHQIIHEEQPYTFLYIPKTTFLYREYVKNVFIPAERQDLVPGANVAEPNGSIFYLEKR